MKRYSSLELPPYRFIPGHAPHPEKEGGYLHGKEKNVSELNEANYIQNEYYLYAIDLFNLGYYWESHVYWEALWNLAGRKGQVADFLKGLIKIAAAGVKFQLEQSTPAKEHIQRAGELLGALPKKVLGVSPSSFVDSISKEPYLGLGPKFRYNTVLVLN